MRRERIEPGISKRSGHYEVQVYVHGVQRQETLPEGATLRDARARRTKLQHDIDDGGAIPPARLTVTQFLEHWLADVDVTAKSRNTLTAYRLDTKYWTRTIGNLKLARLRPADVEAGRDSLAKRLAPKSVKNALGTLKVALNWGVRHDVVARNVASGVRPPSVERFESHWASQEEAQRLLAVFERYARCEGPQGRPGRQDELHTVPYACMLAIALLTCLRVESEWGGMRWRDVNLTTKTASLTKARLQDGSVVQAGNSKHKRRLIQLSKEAVHFLDMQRRWQAKMRDENSGGWVDPEGFVFTNQYGERIRQSTLQRQFVKMQAEAGAPYMRVHDLRHTGATLLLAAGVNVKIVSDMLGHSSIKMTLDTYGHAVPGLEEAAASQLGAMLTTRLTKELTFGA